MKALTPLLQSHEHDAFETELKQMFVALYQLYLADAAQNINVYGNPYLGNRDLIQKSLVADGIGNFEADNVSKDILQYLLMANRYRNGKRGLHLLNTYLRCLWSDNYKAYQLHFVKDGVYAEDGSLFSLEDIAELEQDIQNFILTNRVRVELDPTITPVNAIPSDVANSLDDTLPARLFIHDIVVRRDVHDGVNIANHSDFFSYTREDVVKFEVEEAIYLSSKPYPIDGFEALQTNVRINAFEIKDVIVEGGIGTEAMIASECNIEGMQLKNVLIQSSAGTEAMLASECNIEGMQLKNVLIQSSADTEAMLASECNIEGMQLKNLRLEMQGPNENLTCNVSINSFSIDDGE